MNLYEKVENKLNELHIEFQLVEHEPAVTTELADKFIEGIEGVRTKTMFLTNEKTIFIATADLLRYLEDVGSPAQIIEI